MNTLRTSSILAMLVGVGFGIYGYFEGVPVPEGDALFVYNEFACARGNKDACAPK